MGAKSKRNLRRDFSLSEPKTQKQPLSTMPSGKVRFLTSYPLPCTSRQHEAPKAGNRRCHPYIQRMDGIMVLPHMLGKSSGEKSPCCGQNGDVT